MSQSIRDAVAGLQRPGVDTTVSMPGGASATIGNPSVLIDELAQHAAEVIDPATDPWPHDAEGEPKEYVRSELIQEIAERMITGLVRFHHLQTASIDYLFRTKKNWSKRGRTVWGQMKKATGLVKSYSESDFILLISWEAWQLLNPMQRVALVYHELRHGGDEGKIVGHEWEGFFDELELFGIRTYEDWMRLEKAARDGARVEHQYTLSLHTE